MVIFIVFLILAVFVGLAIWAIGKSIKAIGNGSMVLDANRFKQAGVEVLFQNGAMIINGHRYDVNQVTALSTEAYTPGSMAHVAIIHVDDFAKPIHKLSFMTRRKAEEFAQRLTVALRKAGGPSFEYHS